MGINVIETIGTLEELKPYCCPRVAHIKEWYLKCVDCKQRKDCTVGTRAVALLNKQTRPQTVHNRMIEFNKQQAAMRAQKAREDFQEALKQSNPVEWIMNKRGNNANAAKQSLRTWKEKYPEIFEASGRKTLFGEEAVPHVRAVNPYNIQQAEKCRERAEALLRMKDPVEYLMRTEGKSRDCAQKTIRKYKVKYPELVKKQEEEEKTMAPKTTKPVTDTDEISVEEFLAEQKDAPKEPEKPAKVSATPYSKLSKEDILLEAVKAKRQEILNTVKDLERRIALEKEKLSTLTKTMAILTGDIFPENPV